VRCHWDADGVTSALFTNYGVPDSEIEVGVYEKGFGCTEGLTKDDWMVDMRPQDKDWNGHCIDHHFPHPDDRKYELTPDISEELYTNAPDIIPASLLAWRKFKDKIPKDEWWKLCIGLGGDGSLELTPPEVFKECPSLLTPVKTSAYQTYGRWKISTYPVYMLLSSCINSLLRKGDYETAVYILKFVKSPMELYNLQDVEIAKRDVKNEYKTAVTDASMYEFGDLVVVLFESKYRMSGYVSSSLQDAFTGKTIMAINTKTGSISLRGKLSPYYKLKLSVLDYIHIDGHAEFMGGKLHENPDKFIRDVAELL